MIPSNLFKLLADETRLRVLMLIHQDRLCVCELCGILEEPQPKISKILSKLRDMDLVIDERKEKFIFYSLRDTNPLLNNSLDFLLTNITDYPRLALDNERLKHKELHIDSCVLASITEVS